MTGQASAKYKVGVIGCEKPISATLADADRMVDACRANGVKLAAVYVSVTKPVTPDVPTRYRAPHTRTVRISATI